jgi:hypothetical protein
VALSPGNSTDFLADVPDIPLQGNLMLLSLNEGSWANQRDDFINYARREHPDIAQKYFGNGTSGSGPIGRHWTHMVLITLTKPNSTELASVQILGKVYDVLPVLKSNSTAPSNTTAIGFV